VSESELKAGHNEWFRHAVVGICPEACDGKRVSRSRSASSRFSTMATKQGALNSHPGFVQEGDPAGWNQSATSIDPMLDQTKDTCVISPSDRIQKRRNPTGRSIVSKYKIQGRLT
jgi:hypothetical protein